MHGWVGGWMDITDRQTDGRTASQPGGQNRHMPACPAAACNIDRAELPGPQTFADVDVLREQHCTVHEHHDASHDRNTEKRKIHILSICELLNHLVTFILKLHTSCLWIARNIASVEHATQDSRDPSSSNCKPVIQREPWDLGAQRHVLTRD